MKNHFETFVRNVSKAMEEKKGKITISLFFKKLPVGIYLLNVNNKNTKTRCKISSKLPSRHLPGQS